MVRYHEAGRFCEKDKDWDRESALFHLEHAADCGELEAIVGLGLMCSQLPHHILSEVTLEVNKKKERKFQNPKLCSHGKMRVGGNGDKVMVRCSVVFSEKMSDFVVKDLDKAPKPLPVAIASKLLCIFRKFLKYFYYSSTQQFGACFSDIFNTCSHW